MEERMTSITPDLLQALSQALTQIPTDPADLPIAVSQLSAQLPGLARLDDLDLAAVEPATVLLPPLEDSRVS
jgi:hypothetical protein